MDQSFWPRSRDEGRVVRILIIVCITRPDVRDLWSPWYVSYLRTLIPYSYLLSSHVILVIPTHLRLFLKIIGKRNSTNCVDEADEKWSLCHADKRNKFSFVERFIIYQVSPEFFYRIPSNYILRHCARTEHRDATRTFQRTLLCNKSSKRSDFVCFITNSTIYRLSQTSPPLFSLILNRGKF